jgi:putative methylase
MGEHAQKRLIRKIDLERFLSSVDAQPNPKVALEQYTTSESVASTLLYFAAYNNKDIDGKTVLDLGCGTGRLGLGAAFLGAKSVVGVDIDRLAIKIAHANTLKTDLTDKVSLVLGDLDAIDGKFDTVLQNPPFGVQKRGADRVFLAKALVAGKVIYSMHSHPEVDKNLISRLKYSRGLLEVPASPFIERFVAEHDGVIVAVYALLMTIPKMFDFHTKLKHDFVIDLYVIHSKTI